MGFLTGCIAPGGNDKPSKKELLVGLERERENLVARCEIFQRKAAVHAAQKEDWEKEKRRRERNSRHYAVTRRVWNPLHPPPLEDDQVKTVKPAVLIKPYLEHSPSLASIEPPNG